MDPKDLLIRSFHAAVAAADPLKILPDHLATPPSGRTLVIGAGKAGASMALAVERHWPPEAPLDGVVITRRGHGLPTKRIKVIEAGHPVPDEAGESGAREIMDRVRSLGPDDLLLALISGGGSALLSLPAQGVGMDALKATTSELLRSGARIEEINTVRKHLSAIQGGRLAAACKGRILALIISDVTGDDPTHIASGPCAPDPTTYADALSVLERYDVRAAPGVLRHLQRGAQGEVAETPKPGDAVFARVENRVVATARLALSAAEDLFRANGIRTSNLGDGITGEARDVANIQAALARGIIQRGDPRPVAVVSGGECTVTVRGSGRGGRCTEFLLSLGIALEGLPGVHAIACDTDGIDGSEDNAGAVLLPDALPRGARRGADAQKLLADNDAYGFFAALGDLVVTGPTRTNVNDYRAILLT
ncbi:MAG TPA: glycerate kinase [Burkholderiales bacterium]|nr:glycerate kinase [Burkholderiales bacterium]HKW51262.1 glycerate kinase [Candidatus Eisenbacteria bacterium]